MYTIEELVEGARQKFKLSPALVAAALKATGKVKFTLKEAQKIVKKFAEQKV